MKSETLKPNRGTKLRKNNSIELQIKIPNPDLNNILLINENDFLVRKISSEDLTILPNNHYMIINKGFRDLQIIYSQDISEHKIVYDPYKYERTRKKKIDPETFQNQFEIPKGYIDILPKWYSIKFTYPKYNLIFIKPEMGLSIQTHDQRSEDWEILGGKPIILSGKKVYYYIASGTKFENQKGDYHTIINPNTNGTEFITIKESWAGNFDEEDIHRIFNPNHYH